MTSTPAHGAALDLRFEQAVTALTDAVLLPTSNGHARDFADFLACVLAAVAANVGSVHRLLAGRSGSWEAALVAQLVEGTVGPDSEDLWARRTKPIVVALNVAELVEDRIGRPGLPEARDRLDAAFHAATPAPDVSDSDDEERYTAHDAAIEALDAAWCDAYRAYGQAFTDAVRAKSATMPGLTAPVTVEVIDDQDADWWSPDAEDLNPHPDDDALAWLLWQHAVVTVPSPVDEHGNLTTPTTPPSATPGTS